MTKYKIVEEKDGNGDVHYEIWTEQKFLWWAFWSPIKHNDSDTYRITRKFSTLESAKKFINVHYRERRVVEEGQIEN
jgi:hypothetical protein